MSFLEKHISSPINKSLAISLGLSLATSCYLLYKLMTVSDIPQVAAQTAEVLPAGTVVAFNLASCPSGWSEYTAARGRTVIGTNPAQFANPGGEGVISARTLGTQGGAETHTLTVAEMPSHNHSGTSADPAGTANAIFNTTAAMTGSGYGALAANTGTRWGVGNLSSQGGGGAHNNMPPFVALLYCQKS